MSPSMHRSGSISELLEPAIEGPPSPESIRAFSNQMRWASTADKHQSRQSHQTSSSGSSSLRSLNSAERPSWDTTTENIPSLSRKSSGRSTTSTQPRDRHESVQIFGKGIFSKRGRLRRESSAQSSSNSSLYSAEVPYEAGAAASQPVPFMGPAFSHGFSYSSLTGNASKDPLIPSFFNRRRAHTRSGPPAEDVEENRKLQISGPFNFQHLTHTQKDQDHNAQRASRAVLQSELASGQTEAEDLQFQNFSSETLAIGSDAILASAPRRFPMRPHATSVSSGYASQRTLPHTRSENQLRVPPPRPPRSPVEASAFSFSPPIPPPRLSSRASLRPGDLDTVTRMVERPKTSGGFRQPAPLSLSSVDMPRPPSMHSHSFSADMSPSYVDTRRFSQMPDVVIPSPPPATHDDTNWPLAPTSSMSSTTFDILPGVPEEEEQAYNPHNSVRRSRMSIASNASSSLRKSHSLPLLQQFPQPPPTPGSQRPPSAASDTLGRLDTYAAQRTLRENSKAGEDNEAGFNLETSWEDDIDYCYEHEIEADCEYAWDRSSVDMSREDALSGIAAMGSSVDRQAPCLTSPQMLSPGNFEMPALSPASLASTPSINEAVTPTGFSMRRPVGLTVKTKAAEDELRPMQKFLHARNSSRGSRASSYMESHGFNLSPSLFIPGSDKYDCFYPSSRGVPVGFAIGADDDEDIIPTYVEPTMTMDKSTLFIPARTSASTTGSGESRDSVLSYRHTSAASTATDLTRLTMSTASIEDLVFKKDQDVPQI